MARNELDRHSIFRARSEGQHAQPYGASMNNHGWHHVACLLLGLAITASFGASPSESGLVPALQHGGHVVLMRHASAPGLPPERLKASSDNPHLERELDEAGRASAVAFGNALRQLQIPIGQVLCSPTFRARETVKLAELSPVTAEEELGDSGHSMTADQTGLRGTWLRERTSKLPAKGSNTLIVTHFPNIAEAYPQESKDLAEGEALILRPDGHGAATFVARVKIEEWARLEADQ